MNNCCCAELVVDEGQQIELNVESDGGIEVGVAEQFVIGGGGNYQDKTVNFTPTESAQSQTVHADVGYDALDEVEVNVAAIADDYVGSAVPRRASSSLTESGATVTAPAGYYANQASKTMTTGHMSVSATKGTVSNHSVAVTPKAAVDNAGYFATGDRTGTAVSVSASELDSGTKSITSNGNSQDVVGYAAVNVNVPNSYTSADEGKVVSSGALVSQTSDTVTTNDTYDTTLINSLTVNVSGGGASILYPFGSNHVDSNRFADAKNGHVKITARSAISSGMFFNLRQLTSGTAASAVNNFATWFTIPSGATVRIKVTNVTNASSLSWSFNIRNNQQSSLGYGIGDGTHLDGEDITVTPTSNQNVGAPYIFVQAPIAAGDILEFDFEMTVNGVRYF